MWPEVFQKLKASADVRNYVGTNPPRIYAHGAAPHRPEGVAFNQAYVTWLVVTAVPEQSLSELPLIDRVPVQVDCFHPDDRGIRGLAIAARDAIEPYAVMTGMPVDEHDPTTKLFHVALTFDWFVDR